MLNVLSPEMFALVFFHNSISQNVADADCTLSTT
ncbi:hypothetical protein K661_02542, partial [Piscirickettsia salmonis LF-89 = ATCC VR-1361]